MIWRNFTEVKLYHVICTFDTGVLLISVSIIRVFVRVTEQTAGIIQRICEAMICRLRTHFARSANFKWWYFGFTSDGMSFYEFLSIDFSYILITLQEEMVNEYTHFYSAIPLSSKRFTWRLWLLCIFILAWELTSSQAALTKLKQRFSCFCCLLFQRLVDAPLHIEVL